MGAWKFSCFKIRGWMCGCLMRSMVYSIRESRMETKCKRPCVEWKLLGLQSSRLKEYSGHYRLVETMGVFKKLWIRYQTSMGQIILDRISIRFDNLHGILYNCPSFAIRYGRNISGGSEYYCRLNRWFFLWLCFLGEGRMHVWLRET